MITLFRVNETYSLGQIKNAVKRQLIPLAGKVLPTGEIKSILRFEFKCEDINILTWLYNQKFEEKLYWSSREGDNEVGGVGTADRLYFQNTYNLRDLYEEVEERTSNDNPHLRFYGGMNFSNLDCSDEWKSFGSAQFIVPLFELFNSNGVQHFAVNIAVNNIKDEYMNGVLASLEKINFQTETEYRTPPQCCSRKDQPIRDEWNDSINKSLNEIHSNEYSKIVLARRSDITFDKHIDPMALMKHLKEKTPGCYHFCFQIDSKEAYLSASPERLFKRVHDRVESEALAGTVNRGENKQEDKMLREQLINSKKDLYEHEFVVDDINISFLKICKEYSKDDVPKVLELKGGQHLLTKFVGVINDDVEDRDILAHLHPTPAVAGTPTEKAVNSIKAVEPFDRGWYAGPIGYFGVDHSEFAVGIRSGIIKENHLSLYAGAGIVAGSKPDDEWNEIENKISRFLKVFDLKVEV